MTIYDGAQFPDWQGDIFVSSLIYSKIIHIDMAMVRRSGKAICSAKSVTACAISAPAMVRSTFSQRGDNGKLWRVSRR